MVIDTNNTLSTGGTGNGRNRPGGISGQSEQTPSTTSSKAPATGKDNVVLSAEAQNLNRLQAKINDMPDVDLSRVAAIKKAIAEGKFEINAERIAENMLKQDELLG